MSNLKGQSDLFAVFAPYIPGNQSSKEAAESINPATLEAEVLGFIITTKFIGATCDEIEIGTAMRHQTASARMRGLDLKGLIERNGQRRRTRSGRLADVWVKVQK